jgi:hypothetical protein
VDYNKIHDLIRAWCEPLAGLHSKYAQTFECDLVIVTGKPSELPAVSELLTKQLPLAPSKIIFAKNYEAGDWFPAAVGGKIPDAKLVTVIGASLYKAIKSGLIPNWQIDEKIGAEVRNYWGLIYEPGQRFEDRDVILPPEKIEADIIVPVNCCIARSRFRQNEPEPVYTLAWRDDAQHAKSHAAEIKLRIGRILNDAEGRPLRNERLEILHIYSVVTSDGQIDADGLTLKLHTLPFDDVHWLDQGKFNVRWD